VGILDVHKKGIMVSFQKIKMSKKEEQKFKYIFNRGVYLQQKERQGNTWQRRGHTKKEKKKKKV
jgi:hypothetical protein